MNIHYQVFHRLRDVELWIYNHIKDRENLINIVGFGNQIVVFYTGEKDPFYDEFGGDSLNYEP